MVKDIIRNQKGSVLLYMLAALSIIPVATLTATKASTIVKSANRYMQSNSARQSMYMVRDFLISNAQDVDGDGKFELLKEGALNAVPISLPVNALDAYNVAYRYCTWDAGSANGVNATYSQNAVAPPNTDQIGRLISAGADKAFQTSCSSVASLGDDVAVDIFNTNVSNSNGGISGWSHINTQVTLLNPADNLGLGVSAPTHKLELAAGTTTAEGIAIGDVEIYRSASQVLSLASGDSFNLASGTLQAAGVTVIDASSNISGNNLTLSGGTLTMSNATSNMMTMSAAGYGAPTIGTRSVGTKLVMWPQVGAASADYAQGIESAAMWSSLPTNSAAFSFKWYAAAANIMALDGTGHLGVGTAPNAAYSVNAGGAINSSAYYINGVLTSPSLNGSVAGQTMYWNGTQWAPTSGVSYTAATGALNIATGDLQVGGVSVVNSSRNVVGFNAVGQNLTPLANNTYNLGTVGGQWANTYSNSFYQNGNKVIDTTAGGTAGYISKFTGANTIGNSLIYDDGTNVGVGTTTPTTKLSIGQPGAFTGYKSMLSFDEMANSGNNSMGIDWRFAGSAGYPWGSTGRIEVARQTTSSSFDMIIHTAQTGVLSEKMRIMANGRVGVGTSAPLSKMDIAGGVAIGGYAGVSAAPSNGLIVSGATLLGSAVDDGTNKLQVTGGTAFNSGRVIVQNAPGTIGGIVAGVGNGHLQIKDATGTLAFDPNEIASDVAGGLIITSSALTFNGSSNFNNTLSVGGYPVVHTGNLSSITSTGTITSGIWNGSAIAAQYGGTGLTSYAVGDTLYASGATSLSRLAGVATGNVMISGGVGVAPSWGKVNLAAHVTGTLPIANLAAGDYSSKITSGTYSIDVTGNATTATSSPLLSSLGSYVWSAATLPSDYNLGIQNSFVRTADGFPNYGSVMTTRTYSGNGGGALQLYTPYGSGYGGTGLQVRFGDYSNGSLWTAWKTLLASDNFNSYAPTLTGTGATGTWGIGITGNAATVTNGVYITGSYADPAWITSLAKAKVGLSVVENTALSTWAGSANITTVGTIGTGTWNGTAISAVKGGTGLTSYAVGDLVYASGVTTLSRLAGIATGNALISGGVGVAPSWGKIDLGTHVSGTLPIANLAAGDYSSKITSGTYNIDITGNAATADSAKVADTRNTVTTPQTTTKGVVYDFKANATEGVNDGGTYFGEMTFRPYGVVATDWTGGPSHQLGFTQNGNIWQRTGSSTLWGAWKKLLDSENFGSYAPTLTGTGATGTWGIDISGNAATVTNGVYTTGSYADPAWITSLAKSKVGLNVVENTALSTWAGTSNLTTVGTIGTGTWNATTIGVAKGGTGLTSYTVGDLLYASGATSLSRLAGVATGNALISGGVGVAPSWGKIDLATHVTGTLPIANLAAGDYSTKITSGTYGIGITGNAATVTNGVYTTGSYADPAWITSLAKAKVGLSVVENTALSTWAGSANITTVGTIGTGTWNGTAISAVKGGTGMTSYVAGDLIYASSTTALSRLADVATGNILVSGGVGVAPAWGKVDLATHVSGTLPIANLTAGDYSSKIISGTYSIGITGNAATVTNGVYTTGSYADPIWITSLAKAKVGLGAVENTALSTWAGTANITTVGTIGTGTWNGTAISAAKGGTGMTTYAVGDLVYASGVTSLSRLAGVATGNALISGGVGVAPLWGKINLAAHVSGALPYGNGGTGLSAAPTNGQLLIGNGTGYSLATLTGTASQVIVTNSAGGITFSLPQSIATTSSPTFVGLTLNGALSTTGNITAAGTITGTTVYNAVYN